MIASPTADIEDEGGRIDSTGGDDLVEHGMWAWVQAPIERREGTALVAGPHMRIDCLHLCFPLGHKRLSFFQHARPAGDVLFVQRFVEAWHWYDSQSPLFALDGKGWIRAPFFPGGVVERDVPVAGQVQGKESQRGRDARPAVGDDALFRLQAHSPCKCS